MQDIRKSITEFIFIEDRPEVADVIFVPGCLRPELMKKAVELYEAGFAPYILPTGGIGPKLAKEIEAGNKQWKSEWDFLASIALENGVPESAILKEDKSLNTFENAQMSKTLLQENNIKIKKAILVCKAHHARRAFLTYKISFPPEVEILVCPVVDERNVKKDNWWLEKDKISLVMSEVEKIGKYFAQHFVELL